MFIETRDYKKMEYDLELEIMMGFGPSKRKDSSFHTKDKNDYSVLLEKNKRRDNIITK